MINRNTGIVMACKKKATRNIIKYTGINEM